MYREIAGPGPTTFRWPDDRTPFPRSPEEVAAKAARRSEKRQEVVLAVRKEEFRKGREPTRKTKNGG